jgi:hypothetical protein
MKALKGVAIDGRYAQTGDRTRVFVQYDDYDSVEVGSTLGLPAYVAAQAQAPFRRATVWLAFEDAANADYICPQILSADLDFDWVGEPFDFIQDRSTQTPETV